MKKVTLFEWPECQNCIGCNNAVFINPTPEKADSSAYICLDAKEDNEKCNYSKKSKDMCRGCYDSDYNHGLGGSKECWSFNSSSLKMRKEVHIDQRPPWNQEPKLILSCYHKPKYVYVDGDKTC